MTTIYNDMISGPGYDPTWYYPPDLLASSAADAAGFIDALNGAIAEVSAAHGATVVDMHAVAHGPEGTKGIPDGWFSPDFGDLNQAGHEAFADEMMRVGFDPLVIPTD